MTMPSDLLNDLAVTVAERFRVAPPDTLQRDLEVSLFVAKAQTWGQTGRIRGVIQCNHCGQHYAVEYSPVTKRYVVIVSRCTCNRGAA